MKLRLSIVIAAVLLCAVAGCKRPGGGAQNAGAPAAPVQAPSGFQHDATFDAAGYYMPSGAIQIGNFRLNTIALGAESDFAQWEKGEREGLFGPILVNFDDVSSPVVTNEMGGEGHAKTLRLLPASYRLYPGDVSFAATDPALGAVKFSGAFDQTALADARKAQVSGKTPVLHGDLQIGDKIFTGATFTYFAGD